MEELGIIRTNSEHKNLQFFPKKNSLENEVFHYRFKFGKFSILQLPRFLEVLMIISLHSISNFEDYPLFLKTISMSLVCNLDIERILKDLRSSILFSISEGETFFPPLVIIISLFLSIIFTKSPS